MAGVIVLPSPRSANIGWPAASKNETAPVSRSTRTASFAVVIVASVAVLFSFQSAFDPGFHVTERLLCVKNARSFPSTTRMMPSEQTCTLKNLSPIGTTIPSATFSGAAARADRKPRDALKNQMAKKEFFIGD